MKRRLDVCGVIILLVAMFGAGIGFALFGQEVARAQVNARANQWLELTAGGEEGLKWVSTTSGAAPTYCAIYKIDDPRAPGGVVYQPLIGETVQRISDQLEHYDVAPENLLGVWELKDGAKVSLTATEQPAPEIKKTRKWHKKP